MLGVINALNKASERGNRVEGKNKNPDQNWPGFEIYFWRAY